MCLIRVNPKCASVINVDFIYMLVGLVLHVAPTKRIIELSAVGWQRGRGDSGCTDSGVDRLKQINSFIHWPTMLLFTTR